MNCVLAELSCLQPPAHTDGPLSPCYTFSCSGWTHKRNWPLLYIQCLFSHLCWLLGLVAAPWWHLRLSPPHSRRAGFVCKHPLWGSAGSSPASPLPTSASLFSHSLTDKQVWWHKSCNSGKQDIWEPWKEGEMWAHLQPVCVNELITHTRRHIGVSNLSCVCAVKCEQKKK